ncbi:conserved hypothetical protein [Theileria orientalis strain Shintoku]|uniref:Uncharacterized protein n=1 Tax=Theileria orientalis strain Shintoku TaxID=869250 RepID=J4D827_THEOR|nr:conserved hypothetical protein [Theileria orientalis strain Shintoku]BAM40525.1 conserved hypothetical protein [Theileria orientalis strain Shintoku]|eukprot:XP_009690826.1 conserved hypothetical protein [Theileria orientalis strain Shintoku]
MGSVQTKLYIDFNKGVSDSSIVNHYSLNITRKDYNTPGKFDYLDYKISFQKGYSYSDASYFYVYIREETGGSTVFEYYVSSKEHVLTNVKVYFSKQHEKIPLVVGFTKTDGTQYYTYKFLKSEKYSYGFPLTNYFKDNELEAKLKEELNNLNKKITFKVGSGTKSNVLEKTSNLPKNKIKVVEFTPNIGKEGSFLFHSSELFKVHSNYSRIEDSILQEVNYKPFDCIKVYYFISDHIPVLIEFVDGKTKTYFKRQDTGGFHWAKDDTNYNNDPSVFYNQLTRIKPELEKWLTYQLNTNHNYSNGNILVSPQTSNVQNKYTVYTHTPKNVNSNTTDVLYLNKKVEVIQNKDIQKAEDRLERLNGKFIKKIDTYALDVNSNDHLLMKLITREGNVYYLSRFDRSGVKWRQLSLKDLTDINIKIEGQINGADYTRGEGLGKTLQRQLGNEDNVQRLLKDISANINSIIVLMERKSEYGGDDIRYVLKGDNMISPADSSSNTVEVIESKRDNKFFCEKLKDYNIYKHVVTFPGDFALRSIRPTVYIRLYSGETKIKLFDEQGVNGPLKYLEYKNGSELYVYFDKKGHNPIMFFYNGETYRTKDKNRIEWLRIKDITHCNKSNTHNIIKKLEEIEMELENPKLQIELPSRSDSAGGQGNRLTSTNQRPGASGKTYNGDHLGINGKPGTPRVGSDLGVSGRTRSEERRPTLQVVETNNLNNQERDHKTQVRNNHQQTDSDSPKTSAYDGGLSAEAIGGGVGGGIAVGGSGIGGYLLLLCAQ